MPILARRVLPPVWQFPEREWKTSRKFLGEKAGEIVKSTRPFGFEIEAKYLGYEDSNHFVPKEVAKLIPEEIGMCQDAGAEFELPPASGDKAEGLISYVATVLNSYQFYCDTSCGLHVHLDTKDIKDSYSKTKKMWLFYLAFEDVIRKMIHPSRRCNGFCKPFSSSLWQDVQDASTYKDLEYIFYGSESDRYIEAMKGEEKPSYRYKGINLHTHFAEGHLEIRYHEGTIDARAMLEWANLHCLILDSIHALDEEAIENGRRIGWRKRKYMFDLIGLAKPSRDYWNKKIKRCVE